jgi:DNA-binding CsgD family transcriptional regulator
MREREARSAAAWQTDDASVTPHCFHRRQTRGVQRRQRAGSQPDTGGRTHPRRERADRDDRMPRYPGQHPLKKRRDSKTPKHTPRSRRARSQSPALASASARNCARTSRRRATLGIAEPAVKAHLVHAFEKLDVENRTAAVRVAIARGPIDA